MDIIKKKFLNDVRQNLKSVGMSNDKVDLIVSEVEVIYNIELERGKSHSEIVKNKFGGARTIAERYGKIFGYSGKTSQKRGTKKIRNKESSVSDSLRNGYNYVRELNKQAMGKNIITGNSKGLIDKVDSALMHFVEIFLD